MTGPKQTVSDMEQVYEEHAKLVYRYLLSLGAPSDMAEDLLQETFYKAMIHMDSFRENAKLSTWLCSIARNEYYQYLRKHPATEEIAEFHFPSIDQREDLMELYQRIHRLENPYQEILFLKFFAGLSYSQIAEIFGKTENWARVMLYRAKEKLKKEVYYDRQSKNIC